MSNKLAPSIRLSFPLMALVFQVAIIGLFAGFVDYKAITEGKFSITYPVFQDVNAVVVIGFGFLLTFLKRYAHSGLAFNLFLAALAVQWATFLEGALLDTLQEGIQISLKSIIRAELNAVSAVISIGAVVGVMSPIQLLLMVALELTCFVVDQWFLKSWLSIDPDTSVMHLHLFGAFFGLTASRVLYRSGLCNGHEKEGSLPISELFSMIGTIFLWMFWPSFNSALLDTRLQRSRAVFNTYYALAACSVSVFAVSTLVHNKGKIDMANIRNATLSGGVAIGLSAPLIDSPYIAMIVGFTAGVISTLGVVYLKRCLETRMKLHDTCGVLYTHGLPGIIGGIVYVVLIFLTSPVPNKSLNYEGSPINKAVAIIVTLSASLVTGLIAGFILKLNIWKQPPDLKCYDDQAYWVFPHLATVK
uniref:Rh blood group, D antigen n=1 Tax=Callorhinchus milii TaxID=7868 RepID=A0A4W3JL16_CALMI|eukprot:gi/632972009/ref/XP_007902449.1/ PREDICTED: ammonium transporter Rh type A-like [Callorhinchus milii]